MSDLTMTAEDLLASGPAGIPVDTAALTAVLNGIGDPTALLSTATGTVKPLLAGAVAVPLAVVPTVLATVNSAVFAAATPTVVLATVGGLTGTVTGAAGGVPLAGPLLASATSSLPLDAGLTTVEEAAATVTGLGGGLMLDDLGGVGDAVGLDAAPDAADAVHATGLGEAAAGTGLGGLTGGLGNPLGLLGGVTGGLGDPLGLVGGLTGGITGGAGAGSILPSETPAMDLVNGLLSSTPAPALLETATETLGDPLDGGALGLLDGAGLTETVGGLLTVLPVDGALGLGGLLPL